MDEAKQHSRVEGSAGITVRATATSQHRDPLGDTYTVALTFKARELWELPASAVRELQRPGAVLTVVFPSESQEPSAPVPCDCCGELHASRC